MNIPITITLGQICTGFLAICAGIAAIGAATSWIIKAVNAAKAPGKIQDERIEALEKKVADLEGYSKSDKSRLEEIEDGNRMTQRALLALLSHGIDGNNREEMVKAKNELTTYLIEK